MIHHPQMVLLSKIGAHGFSAKCEKVRMLLPQRNQGTTVGNHTLFIANCHSDCCKPNKSCCIKKVEAIALVIYSQTGICVALVA